MTQLNALLSKIESARLWNDFHKDWLLALRDLLRPQLPGEYRVFLESETVLISPQSPEQAAAVILPDIALARIASATCTQPASSSTTAVIEVEENCETETHYSLIIRRAPDQFVVGALELLSPSNKGFGNRWDQERHLKKRAEYLDAGVSLLELDALRQGERHLPAPLKSIDIYDRNAWTAFHHAGRRRYRDWGWNEADPLPQLDWQIDEQSLVCLDLPKALAAAIEFNHWDQLARDVSAHGTSS